MSATLLNRSSWTPAILPPQLTGERQVRAALSGARVVAAGVILALAVYLLLVGTSQAATVSEVGGSRVDRHGPLARLASPQQEVRDKAAAELRATYRAIPQSRWTPVLETLTEGQKEAQVLKRLRSYHLTLLGEDANGVAYVDHYRLDDEWVLDGKFRQADRHLISVSLHADMSPIWVTPPPKFSGRWTTYYVNGQKYSAVDFRDNEYDGTTTSYYANGAISQEEYYKKGVREGVNRGYYPSGKLKFKGEWKHDQQVGTWTYYDETGKVSRTDKRGKP